ncbi:hypothetical protein IEO21_01271 [Rhodonia placenta]|uniref:BTB domain-containing protein n=1 Tax=Rhodonia placenta TaxID=104341 RepID=A0A8H7P9R3_9APHY|nr:hypothetical protein IEO21_01271 [Postia placenta]
MQDATSFLKHQMLHFACNSPLRVFAIACRHGLEDVASATALALSKKAREPSVGDFADELHDLTAGQYMRLLQFCQNPETAPESFCRVKTTQPRNGEDEMLSKAGDSVVMVEGPSLDSMEPDFVPGRPQLRNDGYVKLVSHAEIRAQLTRFILVVPEMFERLRVLENEPIQKDNDAGRIVACATFLSSSYPKTVGQSQCSFNFADLYSAAKKYGIASVLDLLEAVLRQHALEEPFATYFVARRFHLQDIATEAARRTLGLPVDNMSCVEMDDTPGQCLVPTSKPHSLNVAIVPTWTRILMANLRPLLRKHPSGVVVMDGRAFAKTVIELHCHSFVCVRARIWMALMLCLRLVKLSRVVSATLFLMFNIGNRAGERRRLDVSIGFSQIGLYLSDVEVQILETERETPSEGGSGPTSVTNHPFTKGSADAVLISSDMIEFRVHRVILSEASHFFDGLFALPQDASTQTPHKEAPVIHVSEHSSVLDPLLRYCYPMADPVLTSLDITIATLEAALKYDLTEATELLKAQLSTHAKAAPLRVYSIACRHRMEDLALVAAREVHCQEKPAEFHPDTRSITAGERYARLLQFCHHPDIRPITAGEYARLLQFCREGSLPERQTFTSSSTTARVLSECGKDGEGSSVSILQSETETADVIISCLDGVDLRAHRAILELASPVLKRMLSDAPITSQSTIDHPANRSDIMSGTTTAADLTESHLTRGVFTNSRINLTQSSRIVSFLLQFCYPSSVHTPMMPFDVVNVYSAAQGYDMKKVLKALEAEMSVSRELKEDPLLVYFLACRCGFQSIARAAAKRTLGREMEDICRYRPEMELVAAPALYNLTKYHAECTEEVMRLTKSYNLLFNKDDKAVSRCAHFARLTRPCWLEQLVVLITPTLRKDITGATLKARFPALLEIISDTKVRCDRCKGWDVAVVFYRTCGTLADEVDKAISRVQLPWEQY